MEFFQQLLVGVLADSGSGPGRRSWYLGRYQPSGRLWPGQPWHPKVSGYETAYG